MRDGNLIMNEGTISVTVYGTPSLYTYTSQLFSPGVPWHAQNSELGL